MSSRDSMKIESRKGIASIRAAGAAMVVQEYLQPDDEGYSVEVFSLKDGRQAGAISCRRGQSIAGDTCKARVILNDAAQDEARAFVAALGAPGPCSVPLRVTERGPVTFGINPRFSGGVSMRAQSSSFFDEENFNLLTREIDSVPHHFKLMEKETCLSRRAPELMGIASADSGKREMS